MNTSSPQTRAERTGYLETSRHADVVAFVEALKADMAPQVVLSSTHERVLQFVSLEALKRCALDLN